MKRLSILLASLILILTIACPVPASMMGAAGRRPQYWWDLGQNDDSALGGRLGTHVRNSSATYWDPDNSDQVTTASTNALRHERKGGLLALLDEPAGTNLIQYSHEIGDAASSSWWSDLRLTSVTANGMLGPDGNTLADGLVGTVDNATHYVRGPITAGISQNDKIAFTSFVKPGDNDWVRLYFVFHDVAGAELGDLGAYYFNVASGVLGTKSDGGNATVHDYMIEEAANGFYRVGIIVSNNDANTAKFRAYLRSAAIDGNDNFIGDTATVNTWLWGADVKVQDYFDSYVPTSGATATRATESGYPLWTNPSGLFNASGTAIIWWRPGFGEADVSTDGGILACKDATASLLYHDVSGNGIAVHDGTTEITVALAFVENTWYKLAITWANGGNFNVGYDSGSGISWGTAAGFDGDFNAGGAGLQLARALQGSLWFRGMMLDDKVWSDTMIDAFGSP